MSGIRIPKLKADPIHIPLPKQVERPFKDRSRPNRQQLKRQLNRELTERLDRVASELEQINPALALAIDKISDHLDQRVAFTGEVEQAVKEFTDYLEPIVIPAKKIEVKKKVHDFAQEIYDAPIMTASDQMNPMLIKKAIININQTLERFERFFKNVEVSSLKEQMESIHRDLSKRVKEIEEQLDR
jgi:mevalonate kinase